MYDFYAQNSTTVVNPSYQIYTYISIWSLLLFTIKDGQSCCELPIQQRGKTIDPHKTKCVGIFRRKKKSLLSFLLIHIPRLGKQKLLWIEKDINLYDTFRLDCRVFSRQNIVSKIIFVVLIKDLIYLLISRYFVIFWDR